jgi:cephamycin C biosynthesis protein
METQPSNEGIKVTNGKQEPLGDHQVSQPRDVTATIFYSTALPSNSPNEKWFIDTVSNPDGSRKSNFQNNPVVTKIHDLRGRELESGLEITGFQALFSPTAVNAELLLSGNDQIREIYYPEVEKLLKGVTGADRIVFFDHTIRIVRPGIPDTDPLHRQPVLRVHVDQTPVSASARVIRHVQPYPSFKRFQIINVWRPIGNIVYDFPLAMADFRSLDLDNDLVPTDLVYPAWLKDKETYSIKFNPAHRWYYLSHMTPDEVLLLKCYDSESQRLTSVKTNGYPVNQSSLRDIAGLTPHTAFFDEKGATKSIKRQSIEVRALVFHN